MVTPGTSDNLTNHKFSGFESQ